MRFIIFAMCVRAFFFSVSEYKRTFHKIFDCSLGFVAHSIHTNIPTDFLQLRIGHVFRLFAALTLALALFRFPFSFILFPPVRPFVRMPMYAYGIIDNLHLYWLIVS